MKNNFENLNSKKSDQDDLSLSSSNESGREIAGLDPKFERFTLLEENKDYKIRELNKNLVVDSLPQEHFVFINPKKGDQGYLVEAPHWRTVTRDGINAHLETEKVKDFFYTLNIKGVGYLKPTLQREYTLDDYDDWNRIDEYELEGAFGLADKGDFMNSDGSVMIKSNYFIENGLRTEAYWAISELKNVIYKGRRKSISDMQALGKIPSRQKVKPEMALRLLKTNTRIAELRDADPGRQKVLLREAFEVFNKETKDKKLPFPELKVDDIESEEIFIEEFTKRIGENLAVLQNLGYIAWHLHSANITLAAEIVDIGPYLPGEDYKDDPEFVKKYHGVWRGTLKDMRDISYDLRYIYKAFKQITGNSIDRVGVFRKLIDSFEKKLDDNLLKKNSSMNKQDLVQMFSKIAEAVLVERRNLTSIKSGADIEDWGIL